MNNNSTNKINLKAPLGIWGVFFFLFSFSTTLFAQSDRQAEQIIADFIRSVEQTAVQADFEMTVFDEHNNPVQEQDGIFRMRGNRFSLIMDDIHVFFDGKTQWTYMDVINEVNITEPTSAELAEINPITILREYQNKSSIRFSAENSRATENHIIEMTPIGATDFNRIFVQINRSTRNLSSIRLNSNQGFSVLIIFNRFQRGVNIPDSSFIFDKRNYQGVFVNDLR